MLRLSFITLALTCLVPMHAYAQTSSEPNADEVNLWRLCPTTGLLPLLEAPQQKPANGQIILGADIIESQSETISKLSGNVSVVSETDIIHADNAIYRMDTQQMDLNGNVQYRSNQFEFNADSMTGYSNSDSSEINNLDFFIPINHGHGTAEKVIRTEDEITYLHNMSYTTCSPDDRVWHFNARETKLDHAEGMGLAKHMTLRLKNIPVLYFPALSFPIDDHRHSGFLYPTIGESSRHGFEFEIPYYWNIAPQADATITPHYMRDRGTQLMSEWRYLNSWSTNQLDYHYLDDDLFGDRRALIGLTHSGRIGSHWATSINGTDISDPNYLQDFGDSLTYTSITHLSQSAALTGQWNNWRFVGRLLSYQTVDDAISQADQPYSLKPDLNLSSFYSDIGLGVEFELENSYTIFENEDRASNKRFDFWSRFSKPFGNSGWFVVPAISGRFTSYELDDPALPSTQETNITRTVPVASLDSGLIFESTSEADDKYQKTFEPRIFYLNTPFRDQEDIPILDTKQPDFGMYQLFEENHFAGIDRISDANQASLSFTNRWLDRQTGAEQFRISLGQVFFYEDREVTLPNQESETNKRSGILAGMGSRFSDYWSSSLDLEWNPDTEKTDKGLLRLRYNRQNRYIFNVGYRYRRAENTSSETLEQADISFNLPAGQHWSIVGRWNRSIEDKLDLDKYFGLEYESCCWAFRILGREFLYGQDSAGTPEVDSSIYFEIVFKGLARTGSSIGRRLEQNISGYKNPFE